MNCINLKMDLSAKTTEPLRINQRIAGASMATRFRVAEVAARHSSGKPGLPADVVLSIADCPYLKVRLHLDRTFNAVCVASIMSSLSIDQQVYPVFCSDSVMNKLPVHSLICLVNAQDSWLKNI